MCKVNTVIIVLAHHPRTVHMCSQALHQVLMHPQRQHRVACRCAGWHLLCTCFTLSGALCMCILRSRLFVTCFRSSCRALLGYSSFACLGRVMPLNSLLLSLCLLSVPSHERAEVDSRTSTPIVCILVEYEHRFALKGCSTTHQADVSKRLSHRTAQAQQFLAPIAREVPVHRRSETCCSESCTMR